MKIADDYIQAPSNSIDLASVNSHGSNQNVPHPVTEKPRHHWYITKLHTWHYTNSLARNSVVQELYLPASACFLAAQGPWPFMVPQNNTTYIYSLEVQQQHTHPFFQDLTLQTFLYDFMSNPLHNRNLVLTIKSRNLCLSDKAL